MAFTFYVQMRHAFFVHLRDNFAPMFTYAEEPVKTVSFTSPDEESMTMEFDTSGSPTIDFFVQELSKMEELVYHMTSTMPEDMRSGEWFVRVTHCTFLKRCRDYSKELENLEHGKYAFHVSVLSFAFHQAIEVCVDRMDDTSW